MAEKILNDAIAKLQDFYDEYGRNRAIEYTFGFFDAVRVIKDMLDLEKLR